MNTLNAKKNTYLDDSWVKTGELINHKKNKKVFSATSYEGASLQIAHQLEAGWNPLAFRVGLEYPIKGKLIYKYKKNQTLGRIKKEFNLNRFNFAYYFHKDLHHSLRWYMDIGKNWSYANTFFMETGGIWGYMLNILPAPAYEVSDDLNSITKHKYPKTHHANLGAYFMFGKEIYGKNNKTKIFFRGDLYLASYNIGFVPLYHVEWGASFMLYKKNKNYVKI